LLLLLLLLLVVVVLVVVVAAAAAALIAELPPLMYACTTSFKPEGCELKETESFYIQA
jgi:hypothetical protein